MAKFVFRLEAVLKQRRIEEDRRRLVVAELERKRLALEDRLGELRAELELERSHHRAGLSRTRLHMDEARHQAFAIGRLEGQARQETLRLAGLLQRLEVARADLLKATTARKGLERLRERRYEEWMWEQERREAAGIDDVVTSAYGRKEAA